MVLDNKHLLQDGCGGGTGGNPNGCGGGGSCGTCNNKKSDKPVKELHACMGLNACKGHDRFGSNDCAGKGYCATQTHVCHTLNNCRGQGGCGLYGDSEEQCKPGANDCAWQGSCATPIQAERFGTMGPAKGKSVWLIARQLFEERMRKSKRNFGEAPFESGPPQKWLQSVSSTGEYDSCGNSGDKYCSFGYNDPNANAQEMISESEKDLSETMKKCSCKCHDKK
ncbi:hypothetical protein [Aureibacter tunicatorum]|uniref:Uncharacterized protein n=1 Tax=Aureibacter tunicatorum TaxID=866807 RepID=A0AAE4BT77_9BACT|nr:hypothetical protein [Aureibacter tunicatorum]MDR6239665.1 hypothetical protein [Aureibacter tunicatorum]BDD04141.1 hypothetical protein AUTU_16240 [Aureibacter tunicatorum]